MSCVLYVTVEMSSTLHVKDLTELSDHCHVYDDVSFEKMTI